MSTKIHCCLSSSSLSFKNQCGQTGSPAWQGMPRALSWAGTIWWPHSASSPLPLPEIPKFYLSNLSASLEIPAQLLCAEINSGSGALSNVTIGEEEFNFDILVVFMARVMTMESDCHVERVAHPSAVFKSEAEWRLFIISAWSHADSRHELDIDGIVVPVF